MLTPEEIQAIKIVASLVEIGAITPDDFHNALSLIIKTIAEALAK